ncbi:MAG: hypothetical protein AAFR96_04770 [Planctomycetota bacterium]
MFARALDRAGLVLLSTLLALVPASLAAGQTASEFSSWLLQYTSGDARADANGDGVLTPADFSAFVQSFSIDRANEGGTLTPDKPDAPRTDWTDLRPSPDSRKIYVSSSGNDSNDGRSPTRPKRTVAAGLRELRTGYPDWLLLKAGDTFYESLSTSWWKRGRSSDEPMVVTRYGEGFRPRLFTGDQSGVSLINDDRREYLAFVGLHFQGDGDSDRTGMNFVGQNISDVLIEDCFVSGYQQGVVIQGFGGRLSDFSLRRNVIVDNNGSTHSQGVYAANTDGLFIEENIFDRNGWTASRGRNATGSLFAHNLYIQRDNTGVVFRNNWTSRASAEGYKSRAGGEVNGNVFLDNPIAVSWGNDGTNDDDRAVTGTINDNLVLGTTDITDSDVRGWGIRVENVAAGEIKRNIVANAQSTWGFGIAVRSERDRGYVRRFVIGGNIVHNHGTGMEIDEDLVLSCTVQNNTLSSRQSGEALFDLRRGTQANLLIRDNSYRHLASGRPFEDGPDFLNFTEWRATNDASASYLFDTFVNEDATMDDYARSIGMSSASQLYQMLRAQRRGNWNTDLTTPAIRAYFREAFSYR